MGRMGRLLGSTALVIAALSTSSLPSLAQCGGSDTGNNGPVPTSCSATLSTSASAPTLRLPLILGGRMFELKFRVGPSRSTSSLVRRNVGLGR